MAPCSAMAGVPSASCEVTVNVAGMPTVAATREGAAMVGGVACAVTSMWVAAAALCVL